MKLLDLFCGAGGAAMGYHRAGFDEILGVDIDPQPDYPFEFFHGDWEAALLLGDFDFVHASPPCQDYTPMSNRWGSKQPRLIPAVRETISALGIAGVIENVAGARKEMIDPVKLTGEMFGLACHRPRLFEAIGWDLDQPSIPRRQKDAAAIYGKPDGRRLWTRKDGSELRAWASIEEGQEALGVPWITHWHSVREAIPPAYAEMIGRSFLESRGSRGS